MFSWLLLIGLAASADSTIASEVSTRPAASELEPTAAVTADADAFVQHVAIPCPADATRTTFPLVPNTLFEVETLEAVNSRDGRGGDPFPLRLREPLRYGKVELVPAGTPVHGEVTHATQNRWGGIAGELVLAARYVQLPQGRLRLRASIAASGKNRIGASTTTAVLFGVAGVFIQSSNKELPAGTKLVARLAEPVTFQCEGASDASLTPANITPDTHQRDLKL